MLYKKRTVSVMETVRFFAAPEQDSFYFFFMIAAPAFQALPTFSPVT